MSEVRIQLQSLSAAYHPGKDERTVLVQEDPLEEGTAAHSSVLAWRTLVDKGVWMATDHRVAKSQTQLSYLECMHRCLQRSLCS